MTDVPEVVVELHSIVDWLIGGAEARLAEQLPTGWPLTTSQTLVAAAGLVIAGLASAAIRVRRRRGRAADVHVPNDSAGIASGGGGMRNELRSALASCRRAFIAVAMFSGLINILMLTGAIFMMEIYDRVLPSRSIATLIGLGLIAAVLFAAQGVLEFIRGRILSRVGAVFDESLSGRMFDTLSRIPLKLGPKGESHQPLRDFDSIRSFLASSGPGVLFDLPWLPLYLFVIYAFHPLLGTTALIGALILVAITVAAEIAMREPTRSANVYGGRRAALAEASRRNAEVVTAMGMRRHLEAEFQAANAEYLMRHQRASDVAGGLGTLSRTLRFMLQSGMLGLGAWLVIQGQATAGIIIAGSVLLGRALAPVDGVIANARNFVSARQSWARLSKLLESLPAEQDRLPLHPPRARLSVEGLTVAPAGKQTPVLHDVSFEFVAGQAVGIIGPSGSGKSCLTRAIVGAWQPLRGKIQLDGASLGQWPSHTLGRYIGYLPQDVELFSGSVARNIARFEPNADPNAIIAAAQAAGVHELITSLPDGYETQIGEHGAVLSAGQRQRVALARALYRDPFLVVLDEPNSNLDSSGEAALLSAIESVKARGGIVLVVAHRPNVLAAVDYILAMEGGRIQQLMPRDEIVQERPALADGSRPAARSRRIMARDPDMIAKLLQAMDDDGPADNVFALKAEPSKRSIDRSEKPRLRVAATEPIASPPAAKTKEVEGC